MVEADIYEALTPIFRDVFQREDLVLTPTLSAKDVPGWDSFRQIEILIAVQQQFGITLGARAIDRLKNVGDLVALLVSKVG